MSDADDPEAEREAIRREKMERLRERAESGATGDDGGHDAPVHVEGPDHLRELVATHEVVLVDFYADWCGPCKQMDPVLDRVAADAPAVVAKVDVDEHGGLAAEASVRGVPTLVAYAGGEPVERLVGAQNESRIRTLVERLA